MNLERRIHRFLPSLYLTLALTLTSILCLITPPFFVPDEPSHSFREIQISHGQLIGQRSPEGVGGMVDQNVIQVVDAMGQLQAEIGQKFPDVLHRPPGRITEANFAKFRSLRWAHRPAFHTFYNTAVYPPVLYLPQAAGWRIGESCNLTILHSLLLARLMAAWSACAIGWLALRLCDTGRWILFLCLLLPTTLCLNASCSQDSLLLASAGLIAALLSRAVSDRRLFSRTELFAMTAVLALDITARPTNLALVFLLLLPSMEAIGSFRKKWLPPLIGIAAIFAIVGVWQASVHALGNFNHPLADPAQQVAFLRSHPIDGALIILRSTLTLEPLMLPQTIAVFGILDIYPSPYVYLAILIGFLGYACLTRTQRPADGRQLGVLFLVLFLICYGTAFAEYIMFTVPAADWIFGLQGRYFTPLLPLLLLALGRKSSNTAIESGDPTFTSPKQTLRGLALAFSLLIFLAGVCSIPWLVAYQFYQIEFPAVLWKATLL